METKQYATGASTVAWWHQHPLAVPHPAPCRQPEKAAKMAQVLPVCASRFRSLLPLPTASEMLTFK